MKSAHLHECSHEFESITDKIPHCDPCQVKNGHHPGVWVRQNFGVPVLHHKEVVPGAGGQVVVTRLC